MPQAPASPPRYTVGMTHTQRLLVGLLFSTLPSLAAATPAPNYAMDCTKPIYLPKQTAPMLTQAFLNKGVPGAVLIGGDEADSLPEGAIIFSDAEINITSQGKYFGPAQWIEFTCTTMVSIVQKTGAKFAVIYTHTAEGKDSVFVDSGKADPCTPSLHKALSGFSCRNRGGVPVD